MHNKDNEMTKKIKYGYEIEKFCLEAGDKIIGLEQISEKLNIDIKAESKAIFDLLNKIENKLTGGTE